MMDLGDMLGRNNLTIGEALADADDLDRVRRALIREQTIRDVMAASGETREIVVEQVDAAASMGAEAVEELTEGEPTTLRDGLERWLSTVETWTDVEMPTEDVMSALSALLAYNWPAGDGEGPQELAQQIHHAFVRIGPDLGFPYERWDELAPRERELAIAAVRDLLQRGVIRPALPTAVMDRSTLELEFEVSGQLVKGMVIFSDRVYPEVKERERHALIQRVAEQIRAELADQP